MRIRVEYTDGEKQIFEDSTLEEAADSIRETVTGCDFSTQVESVEEIDENDEKLRTLYCDWGLKLTTGE